MNCSYLSMSKAFVNVYNNFKFDNKIIKAISILIIMKNTIKILKFCCQVRQ